MERRIVAVSGRLVQPSDAGPWPGVIVVHEWWGLDKQTKRNADRFAHTGYLAYEPDLFDGERAQLGDNAKATSLIQEHASAAPSKLQSVYDVLKPRSDCSGKVGCVGFCF